MALVQSIEYALADRVSGGISKSSLDAALANTAGALDWLRARHADGKLPLLRLPEKTSDLDEVTESPNAFAPTRATSYFSAPADRVSAGRRWRNCAGTPCPGLVCCAMDRGCIFSTISIRRPLAKCWRGCRSPTRASLRFRNPAAPRKR